MPSQRSAIHPARSLRKLRTAFSPFAAPQSTYTIMSESSPLSASSSASPSPSRSSSGRLSTLNSFGNLSNISLSLRNVRSLIRRSPSQVELEQEEERQLCGDELLDLVEPRPEACNYVGGFEEVLFGRF